MPLPEWRTGAEGVHTVSFALTVSTPGMIRRLVSPSHTLETTVLAPDRYRVASAIRDEFPNRDLVLEADWEAVAPFAWAASDGEKHILHRQRHGFGWRRVSQPKLWL